jgi:Flp pilus assembly protein TadG
MKSRSGILLKGYRQCRLSGERGAFMIIFALMLLVILGFTALGVEAGRWYLVRAELAKGVDAAALVAARNISNPYVSPTVLAEEFGVENFHAGYIGTPGAGAGTVKFTATMVESDKVRVAGRVQATAILAKLFGVTTIPVSAVSMAQKKDVEIMMILDRTGSMTGEKIKSLKSAAKSFLDFFEDTQDRDRLGLISYSYEVKVNQPLQTESVGPMKAAINGMCPSDYCVGATNMEDAYDQANGPKSFTDQTGVPGDKRLQQFVVFFSDGMPTAFRGKFRRDGKEYDGVASHTGTCKENTSGTVSPTLRDPITGDDLNVTALDTGDGKTPGGSLCAGSTTKWYVFEKIPLANYSAEHCYIPREKLQGGNGYFCKTARQLTLEYAKVLKDRGIKIYVIGLGTDEEIDKDFLKALSSGADYTYITPNSKELESIFNKIAKDIKLRLVQ